MSQRGGGPALNRREDNSSVGSGHPVVPPNREELLRLVEVARIERDTLSASLHEKIDEINRLFRNRGRRTIVCYMKRQLRRRLERVREAHLQYNRRIADMNQPLGDAYIWIVEHDIRVRDTVQLVEQYLFLR